MADLTITIDAQTLSGVRQAFGEVQRAFAQLERATQQTATRSTINLAKIESKLGDLSRATRNFGLVATAAVGGLVTALVRAGTQAQSAEAALRTLTGSAERGRQLFEQINQEAARSVMERATMLRAAQQLLAAQINPGAILPTLRAIDAALAATGDASTATAERIARAFAQIAAKGRLSMEEVQQLSDAGVPALKILQQELGLTAEGMRNLMEGKQALSSGQALAALVNGLTRNFSGLRQELMQTPVGQLSNLRDNLQRLLTDAGSPLAQALTTLLKTINEQLSEIIQSGELAPLAESLAQAFRAVAQAAQGLIPLLRSVLDVFNSLPAPMRNTIATIALIAGPAALAASAIANLVKSAAVLLGALRAIPAAAQAAIAWLSRFSLFGGGGAAGAGAVGARAGLARLGAVGAALALTTASAGASTDPYTDIAQQIVPQSIPNRDRVVYLTASRLSQQIDRGRLYQMAQSDAGRAQIASIATEAYASVASRLGIQPATSVAPAPVTPALFGGASAGLGASSTSGRARGAIDSLSRMRASLDLARQGTELSIPSIAQMIAQGDLDAAAQAIARARAELERLLPSYIRLREIEAQAQLGRAPSARERATIAETARRDLLGDVLRLEEQIGRAKQEQAQREEERLRMQREQLIQLQRELQLLQIQLLQRRISNLPPEQALQQLPTLQRMLQAPHVADLATAILSGDTLRAGISATQLQIIQEDIARQRAQLEERIAEEQRRRAQEQYNLLIQTTQAQHEINRLKRESALVLAEAELQNARDTLQILQQQGASREILQAQAIAVAQAQERYLLAQKDSLLAQQQQIAYAIEQLKVEQLLAALVGDRARASQIAVQVAQSDLDLAHTQAALAQIERQIKNINIVADQNNPFEVWRRAVYDLTVQLADGIADAIMGIRKGGNVIKEFFQDLGRTLLRIILREIINPLVQAIQAVAAQIGRAIFGAAAGASGAGASAASGVGALGAFGGVLGAAAIGYVGGQMLGLNPTGSAIGAGIGMAIGGPIGAVVGGLLGGLIGGRRRQPQPQIVPIAAQGQSITINNAIRLYLDNREISRALVSNAL